MVYNYPGIGKILLLLSFILARIFNGQTVMSMVVFDSGMGGLSIYNEIRRILPDLHYIYAFDNQGFPYGNKTVSILVERIRGFFNVISQAKHIDLAVIACNTATTACIDDLRNYFGFPVVGVVPAIKSAVARSRSQCIGLLATPATINSPYIAQLITKFGKNSHIELLGLSELAVMAEEKLQGVPVNRLILARLMTPWLDNLPNLDTIILGCTHYPFIEKELAQLFPQVEFIDSGEAVARRVQFLSKSTQIAKKDSIQPHNLAICTSFDNKVNKIIPVLTHYDLPEIQTVVLPVV